MSGPLLHLVRTAVAPTALRTFAAHHGVLDDDLGYALHLALRRRFGAAAPQPWRLMPGRDGGPDMLLGYSHDKDALRAADPRADARPEPPPDWEADWRADDDAESALAAIFPHPFETKAMPRAFAEGAAYGFTLRMRPVVRYGPRAAAARSAADRQGGHERDAFLAALEQRDLAGGSEANDPLEREPIYQAWLEQRLGSAARLSAFRLVAHRRIRTVRSIPPDITSRRRPGFAGPETVVDGVLTIADPAAFTALLGHGVGRHGAFGFGMLLLRPAGG
ncbi:type I-E CRISPR-associated protein Cas6/Cse3/CasE [Methylobacterium sp. SyP6R]|uniref:type I-E CRISPR-associated protein Cas6/Cse3/CasE n=1 Tax=Methylobacterium sp. SyP6R TaxID=2718876 RepID=UPI001F1925BD|nr:type I-E CRISPR-associated protein Cas6/Cse3/CasE [Methylobacterium sp. SyP6R]MCF4129599.1 type I-E CRISPR-associated protein Cas6/Cse3/CasE [Methylobacterium sp. SyP6R]